MPWSVFEGTWDQVACLDPLGVPADGHPSLAGEDDVDLLGVVAVDHLFGTGLDLDPGDGEVGVRHVALGEEYPGDEAVAARQRGSVLTARDVHV